MNTHSKPAARHLRTDEFSKTFRICFRVSLIVALLLIAGKSWAEDVQVLDKDGKPWTIRIVPAGTADDSNATPIPPPPAAGAARQQTVSDPDDNHGVLIIPDQSTPNINGMTYRQVYDSIPFNRAEYLANPGYRHEATMEILFGQLRPTTIVKEHQPQVIENVQYGPYQPYRFANWDYYQTSTLLRPRLYRDNWCSPYWGF